MSQAIQIVTDNEFQSLPCETNPASFLTMVGLRAAKFETSDITERAGMDIIAVLDRSGSMAGEKMQMLQDTMEFMVENMKDIDRVGLITYDSVVDTILPLTQMTREGKDAAKAAIRKIADRGCTNLCEGLVTGLAMAKDRPRDGANEVCSVLLLTDGLANEGIKDAASIERVTVERLQDMQNPTSVYCFGFGSDHDSSMLSTIAKAGHGTYYFMKDKDVVPGAFADCLGGLMSVVAQNIKLTISAADGVVINSISTIYEKTSDNNGRDWTISIGDLFSEEERDILVDVQVPTAPQPTDAQVLLHIQLRCTNVITSFSENTQTTAAIARTDANTPIGAASETVDMQRNRLRTATAMDEARKAGDAGNLDQAKDIINRCVAEITASASAAASAPLIQDLQSVIGQLQSAHEYHTSGHHRLVNKLNKHQYQRGCESAEYEMDYRTSAKANLRAQYKNHFDTK